MSKERLEEFKKQIDFIDDSADMDDFGRFVDTLQNMYEDGEFHWIVRYLKEQAERVEELEEKKRKLNFAIGSYSLQVSEISQMIEREVQGMKKLSNRMVKGESE